MTATIIKMGDGFYIPKLDGFDDIQKETIEVNINLDKNEVDRLSYKELKGIAIIERYYEKLDNQSEDDTKEISPIQKEFRQKHNINMSLDEYLKSI